MAHFLCLSLAERSFVKAWKRYQSNGSRKPKTEEYVEVLQSAQFCKKHQDGGDKINKLLLSFVRNIKNIQYQQINTR